MPTEKKPVPTDKELQDLYRRAELAGVLDGDKELRDLTNRASAAGIISGISGEERDAYRTGKTSLELQGSAVNLRRPQNTNQRTANTNQRTPKLPGVTFRDPQTKKTTGRISPSVGQGDVRQVDRKDEAFIKSLSSMKGHTPEQLRAQDTNAPRFSNKSMGRDIRDMVGAEADSLFMIPEVVRRHMAGDSKGAVKTMQTGLKSAGESVTGRAMGGLLSGSIRQGEGGAASRNFAQGALPGAGGLAGFSAGARVGGSLPIANPLLKGAATLGLGMVGAAGGGAAAAGAQRGLSRFLLGEEGLRELDTQSAIDQRDNPLASSIGQASTALLFGKPTADDVKAIPQIIGMVRGGIPLRVALASPAGKMLSETLRERAMEAGVEVLAAAGENLVTGKKMNWQDAGVQALSGALLPGENRLGRVFTGAGSNMASTLGGLLSSQRPLNLDFAGMDFPNMQDNGTVQGNGVPSSPVPSSPSFAPAPIPARVATPPQFPIPQASPYFMGAQGAQSTPQSTQGTPQSPTLANAPLMLPEAPPVAPDVLRGRLQEQQRQLTELLRTGTITPAPVTSPAPVATMVSDAPVITDPHSVIISGVKNGTIKPYGPNADPYRVVFMNEETGEVVSDSRGNPITYAGFMAKEKDRINSKRSELNQKALEKQVLNNEFSAAEVERLSSQGLISDAVHDAFSDKWNASSIGYKMGRKEARQSPRPTPQTPQYDSLSAMQSASPDFSMPEYVGPSESVAPPKTAPLPTQKEPWQMTRGDYLKSGLTKLTEPEYRYIDGGIIKSISYESALKQKRITKEEFQKRFGYSNPKQALYVSAIADHHSEVYQALRRGEDVPSDVMQEFPTLTYDALSERQTKVGVHTTPKFAEAEIRRALRKGEPIPARVLSDYPELAARYGRVADTAPQSPRPIPQTPQYDSLSAMQSASPDFSMPEYVGPSERTATPKPAPVATPEDAPVPRNFWEQTKEQYLRNPQVKRVPKTEQPIPNLLAANIRQSVGVRQGAKASLEIRADVDPDIQGKVFLDLLGQTVSSKRPMETNRHLVEALAPLSKQFTEETGNDSGLVRDADSVLRISITPDFAKWLKMKPGRNAVGTGSFATRPEVVMHDEFVESALRKGEPVPPRVLSDYPELAARYGRVADTAPQSRPRPTPSANTYDSLASQPAPSLPEPSAMAPRYQEAGEGRAHGSTRGEDVSGMPGIFYNDQYLPVIGIEKSARGTRSIKFSRGKGALVLPESKYLEGVALIRNTYDGAQPIPPALRDVVLSDYPDIAAKYQKPAATPGKGFASRVTEVRVGDKITHDTTSAVGNRPVRREGVITAPNADTDSNGNPIHRYEYKDGSGRKKTGYVSDALPGTWQLADSAPAPKPTPAPQDSPASDDPVTLASHAQFFRELRASGITPEGLLKQYERALDSKAAIIAELNKKTVAEINRFVYPRPGEKKADIIDRIFRGVLNSYTLDKTVSWQPLSETYEQASRRVLEGLTQADIDSYREKRKDALKAKEKEEADTAAAIENPQTYEDYRTLLRLKGIGSLTPEQKRTYEDLLAEKTKASRKAQAPTRPSAPAPSGQSYAITEHFHSKRGANVYIAAPVGRMEEAEYKSELARAKALGGYYSRAWQGSPGGFAFKTNAEATAFVEGSPIAPKTEETSAEEGATSKNPISERMRATAERMEEAATESLNRDRKANTAKRASQAASAEADANRSLRIAKTMRAIADAIESGTAKYLDGVKSRTVIEDLDNLLKAAKWAAVRANGERTDTFDERPVTIEDIDKAEYPYPGLRRSDLKQALSDLSKKRIGKARLASLEANALGGEPVHPKKIGNLPVDSVDTYSFTYEDREKIGYGKKIPESVYVYAIKAGGNVKGAEPGQLIYTTQKEPFMGQMRMFTTPQDAAVSSVSSATVGVAADTSSRFYTPYDPSRWVTIKSTTDIELLQYVGQLPDWQVDRFKRLQAADIKTPAELKAALREYLGLVAPAPASDPIKKAERELIGRKIPGYFPTPPALVEKMLGYADVQPGMSVLEPSAGKGNIADAIKEAHPDAQISAIEPVETLRTILEAKGYELVGRDFLQHEGEYDRIVMNPPFEDGQDMAHVRHAYDLLKPGGTLVAITSEGPFFRSDKKAQEFRQWLEETGATDEKNPDKSFMDSERSTGVATRMVTIEKPANAPRNVRTADTLKEEAESPVNKTPETLTRPEEPVKKTAESMQEGKADAPTPEDNPILAPLHTERPASKPVTESEAYYLEGKAKASTGLTARQEEYLGDRLKEIRDDLPEVTTMVKGERRKDKLETSEVRTSGDEKPIKQTGYSQELYIGFAPGAETVSIKVPGDGTFKVGTKTQADNLLKAIGQNAPAESSNAIVSALKRDFAGRIDRLVFGQKNGQWFVSNTHMVLPADDALLAELQKSEGGSLGGTNDAVTRADISRVWPSSEGAIPLEAVAINKQDNRAVLEDGEGNRHVFDYKYWMAARRLGLSPAKPKNSSDISPAILIDENGKAQGVLMPISAKAHPIFTAPLSELLSSSSGYLAPKADSPKKPTTKRDRLKAAQSQEAENLKSAVQKAGTRLYSNPLPDPAIISAAGKWLAYEVAIRGIDTAGAFRNQAEAIRTMADEFGDWVTIHQENVLESAREFWQSDIVRTLKESKASIPTWIEGEGALGAPEESEPEVHHSQVQERDDSGRFVASEVDESDTEGQEPISETPATQSEEQKASPKSAAPVKAPASANPDARKLLTIAVQQEIAEELGEDITGRDNLKRTWSNTFVAASEDFDALRESATAKALSENPGTLSDEERVVAAQLQKTAREKVRELLDKGDLTQEEEASLAVAIADAALYGRAIVQTGSELGRGLNFSKALMDDAPGGFMRDVERASTLAEEKLSQAQQRALLEIARQGERIQAEVALRLEEKAQASIVEAQEQAREAVQEQAREAASKPARYRRTSANPKSDSYGQTNEKYTRERYEEAKKKAQAILTGRDAKPGQRGATLLDDAPIELMRALVDIGGFHFEAGLKRYADWATQVREDIGQSVSDKALGKVWNKVATESRRFMTADEYKAAVDSRLETMAQTGKAPATRPRTINPLLDQGVAEYAKGARSLEAFTRGLENRLGESLPEPMLRDLFKEAARKYSVEKGDVQKVKQELTRKINAALLANRPPLYRMASQVLQAKQKLIALKATFDISFFGRQGGKIVTVRPEIGIKAFREGMQALRSPGVALALDGEILAEAEVYGGADHWKKIGLDFTLAYGEENTEAGKLDGPLWTWLKEHGIERSEEANRTILNRLRLDYFKRLVKPGDPVAYQKSMAALVNIMSSRAYMGEGETKGKVTSIVSVAHDYLQVWSPRNNLANLQFIGGTALVKPLVGAATMSEPADRAASLKASGRVMAEYARYAATVGTTLAILAGLAKAFGWEDWMQVDMNPRSKDFGRVRIGQLELDFTSGWRKHWAFLSEVSGVRQDSAFDIAARGKDVPPQEWKEPDRGRVLDSYGRSMLNPLAGEALTQLKGRDFKGSPVKVYGLKEDKNGVPRPFFSPVQAAVRGSLLIGPIGITNWAQALMEQGSLPKETAAWMAVAMPFEFIGLGTSVRDRKPETVSKQREKDAEQRKGFTPASEALRKLIAPTKPTGAKTGATVTVEPPIVRNPVTGAYEFKR